MARTEKCRYAASKYDFERDLCPGVKTVPEWVDKPKGYADSCTKYDDKGNIRPEAMMEWADEKWFEIALSGRAM
jgi:hypothetical protein